MTIKAYRLISLGMAIVFGIVGLMFLLISSDVLIVFNEVSQALGMKQGGTSGHGFYVILAVAYMYVVTLLAWLMYRNPENLVYPQLLINAKFASSILSFLFFFFGGPLLIYLVNGIVDGLIGVLVIVMRRSIKRT